MLFSIITITYNNLEGLKQTHKSVQEQTCTDYEWIIIDGASDDGTVEYINNLPANWTSKPDNGIYDAMNKGIEKATGTYVIFMNAGDVFAAQDVLEKIEKEAAKDPIFPDFIYGDSLEKLDGQNTAYKRARSYEQVTYGLFTHHQSMLYKRDNIAELRYDTAYKISADYKFTLQFLKNCKIILYCPYPLSMFESGGISQTQTKLGRREQFKVRVEEKPVSLAKNIFIYYAQSLVMALRNFTPDLYWKLKRRK